MARARIVHFEGLRPAYRAYQLVEYRPPRKGEFYLSGAIVQAYRAPADLPTSYHVVKPLAPRVMRAK